MPHQVSVFAENKPGKISRITEILNRNNINIRAITISNYGNGTSGIIKLLLDKPQAGNEALQGEGIVSTLIDIVAIKIDDTPGGLHRAASVLSREQINVEDAYGFTIREKNLAIFVFQVENVPLTEKILESEGFEIISDNELYFL